MISKYLSCVGPISRSPPCHATSPLLSRTVGRRGSLPSCASARRPLGLPPQDWQSPHGPSAVAGPERLAPRRLAPRHPKVLAVAAPAGPTKGAVGLAIAAQCKCCCCRRSSPLVVRVVDRPRQRQGRPRRPGRLAGAVGRGGLLCHGHCQNAGQLKPN